jgi:AcrR family transcriptional regulator
MGPMDALPPSTKEQIVLAAERLLGERGLEGVSLRQLGAEAGSGNNSVVQYHFGTKDRLIQAIFEYRLPQILERRRLLVAERRPRDLRACVECYVLPILEQGEMEGSHYLTFVAMLHHHGRHDVFERLSDGPSSSQEFHDRVATHLTHIPEPLRSHRVVQAITFSVHATADRERARASGEAVLPFAVHVSDLFDGLVGLLSAPVSPAALAALDETDLAGFTPSAHL